MRSGKRSPWTEDPTLDEVLAEAPELESLPETSPEVVTTRRDLHAKLLDRLRERLSATGLHLFHLTIVEERPIEEVCAETGMARGAVYTWKSRLLGTIRTLARELEGEPSSAPDRRRGGGVTP